MNDQLQRIYEKRYGTEFSQTNQEPFSATTSMLLQAAREEKERSKRKQKRAKQRQRTQGYAEDDDDAATDLQLSQKSSKAPRKIEEERRQIWLNIARKDVPRVSVHATLPRLPPYTWIYEPFFFLPPFFRWPASSRACKRHAQVTAKKWPSTAKRKSNAPLPTAAV